MQDYLNILKEQHYKILKTQLLNWKNKLAIEKQLLKATLNSVEQSLIKLYKSNPDLYKKF